MQLTEEFPSRHSVAYGITRLMSCATMIGEPMPDETQSDGVAIDELLASTLAMTDALAKLLIGKGVITDSVSSTLSWVPRKQIIGRAETYALTLYVWPLHSNIRVS